MTLFFVVVVQTHNVSRAAGAGVTYGNAHRVTDNWRRITLLSSRRSTEQGAQLCCRHYHRDVVGSGRMEDEARRAL